MKQSLELEPVDHFDKIKGNKQDNYLHSWPIFVG